MGYVLLYLCGCIIMRGKSKHIPVNRLPAGTREGIVIARSSLHGPPNNEQVERSHRDGGYSFIIQEKGITRIEIDFKKYQIKAGSLIFIHPDQVHRVISFEKATICSWIMTIENIRPELLQVLEELAPVGVLRLPASELAVLSDTGSQCIRLSERTDEKLYDLILRESCNTLVALVASQYLAQSKPLERLSRFEIVTKAFRGELAQRFATVKRPAAYAELLHVSAPYLNECVKTATGESVSYHIQERVVLEAKRLLYHSHKSVKEIAFDLGYEDYSYFTRLFVKVTGMTPVAFRSKNLE